MLGMQPKEFWNMLPVDFWHKVDGFYDLENMREKMEWERCRWQTTLLLNIQLPKNKNVKPTELIEFDWDKKNKKKIDIEKLRARADFVRAREMSKIKKNK